MIAVMDHFFQIGTIGPPELEMLEVLRGHCSREGRDNDEITKTCLCSLDPARPTKDSVGHLRDLAALGIQTVIVNTPNLWEPGRVEQIAEVIPAVGGAVRDR